MLDLQKIDQFYGDSHTLWDIDLEVKAAKCTCLMGRNGVGKTTLLKTIMGEEIIRSGKMIFDGQSIEGFKAFKRAGLGIGYVPQGRQIFPRLTVEENLKVAFEANAKQRQMPEWVLSLFPILKSMKSRLGGDLSGGQQQQLAIARALVSEPKLLLLDRGRNQINGDIESLNDDMIKQYLTV